MTLVVFVGPSLPLEDARSRLAAVFLPPCAAGDVYAAVGRYRPKAIGIIDGYFEVRPAVWHKEILYAMAHGVAVFGASSMGALRAVELQAFGMRGIGRVFADYADGTIEDDDEVAMSHLPAEQGYRAVSVPMVNIREGLRQAREAALLTAAEEGTLLASAKARFYPERSWEALWTSPAAAQLAPDRRDALRHFVSQQRPDIKRIDASDMLDAMSRWQRQGAAPPGVEFAFEPTIFWEHLCAYYSAEPPLDSTGLEITREQLLSHVRLADPDRKTLMREALLAHLVEREAARLGLADIDDRTAMTRFRRERGLLSLADLQRWLAMQRVSQDECLTLAHAEARTRMLGLRYASNVDMTLPLVLKARGHFDAALQGAAAKWRRLKDAGIVMPSEPDVESIDQVLDWYQSAHGNILTSVEEHCVELGFGLPDQFVSELVATFLAAHPALLTGQTDELAS